MFETHESFINFLSRNKSSKELYLFLDIETLQYNEAEGYGKNGLERKPSNFKNVTYSVAWSWIENKEIYSCKAPSFKHFFDLIIKSFTNPLNGKTNFKGKLYLCYHNGNRYDNHFMLKDICYFYPDMIRLNAYLKQAENNDNTTKIAEGKKINNVILEKRVKSSNNLEMEFFLKGIRFSTVDTVPKTALSLASIGKKLYKKGYVKKSDLKTSFQYTKYNLDEDLTESEAYEYAENVFYSLDEKDQKYIRNDVFLLASLYLYYDKIFIGFDFNSITFSKNVLDFYNDNDLTKFQLLNKFNNTSINYTDYVIGNENFYDFLKPFYKGGLNLYNEIYLNKIIEEESFSLDINSSYPYAMEHFPIPTFLESYRLFTKETTIPIINDDNYYLYRMDKETFNREILLNINSRIAKQLLVKYYSATNDYVNINTYTLKIIKEIFKVDIRKITVICVMKYSCVDFGSKDKIFEKYFVKTQGKIKNKIEMKNPYEYEILDEINEDLFTQEEIDNAKVVLNGLYGIPALRAYFNLFRLENGELINYENGFKNSQRNILFSVFVTSVALYNLLSPLKNLTPDELDNNFLYADTDSLYLKKAIYHKIDKSILDPYALGKWDVEHESIEKMFILNHKKYCYVAEGKIQVRSGGIEREYFYPDKEREDYDEKMDILSLPFEEFISKHFSHGVEIKSKKSIYNKQGTISIYESKTTLEKGSGYPNFFVKKMDKLRDEIFNTIRKDHPNGLGGKTLYIETPLGFFSESDIYPRKHDTKNKKELYMLQAFHKKIKQSIL